MKNKKDIFNGYILKKYKGAVIFSLILFSSLLLAFALAFGGICIFVDEIDLASRIMLAVLSGIASILWIVYPLATILTVRSYPKHKRLARVFLMNYVFVKIPDLRICGLSDARLLAQLGAQAFWETFASFNSESDMREYIDGTFSTEQITRELDTPNSMFIIAETDGRPAAYMKLNTEQAQTENNRDGWVEIQRLYVLSEYKRMHIGSALMERALEYAKSINADGVWLGVWEHNHAAQEFYKRHGFVAVGSHEFILGSDVQTDIIMENRFDAETHSCRLN